jgi:hypothetical protein
MTVLSYLSILCSHTGDYEGKYIFGYDVSEKRFQHYMASHHTR